MSLSTVKSISSAGNATHNRFLPSGFGALSSEPKNGTQAASTSTSPSPNAITTRVFTMLLLLILQSSLNCSHRSRGRFERQVLTSPQRKPPPQKRGKHFIFFPFSKK